MQEDHEVYHWMHIALDITRLLADVKAGRVHPRKEKLDWTFIASYAEQMLALKRDLGANQKGIGIFASVNAGRALEMPQNVLDEPLVLMNVGRNKGLIRWQGSDQNFVMADGNHRIARAYFDYREKPMDVLVFSFSQTRKYMI